MHRTNLRIKQGIKLDEMIKQKVSSEEEPPSSKSKEESLERFLLSMKQKPEEVKVAENKKR